MEQTRGQPNQDGDGDVGAGEQPTGVQALLESIGLEDESDDLTATPDEVTSRLQQMLRGDQGQEPGDEQGEQTGEGPVDPLRSFREVLEATEDQDPEDDKLFEEELAKADARRLVPRERAERLKRQRDDLRSRLAIGEDGKTGAYDEVLALIKQAGPDSRTAIQNLTSALWQQFQQQAQQQQGGYDYMGQQAPGGYPPQTSAAPVFAPQQQAGGEQPPAWAQGLIGRVENLAAQTEQQARSQAREGLLKSVETELRKWDLLNDPLAQQHIGLRMQQEPSVPIPELVKQYAEMKRKSFEQVSQPAGGSTPPPGSLSPDIGRGMTGAMPPARGLGIDLRKLQGDERVKVAEALIRGTQKR
jgi:hypothetical protein